MPLRDSSEVAARPCRGPGHQQQRRNSSAGRRVGVDLLSPGYQEVLQAAPPRQISAPVPGINPLAIATQFILQQQQAAAAAAAAQAQALAVGVGMPVPYQAVMLQQVQALQHQQQQQVQALQQQQQLRQQQQQTG